MCSSFCVRVYTNFCCSSSVTVFGSALPLLRFFTSPTNKPIKPFLPFLYSFTLSGIWAITSSTQVSISLLLLVCNKFKSVATCIGVMSALCISTGKMRCEAMEKFTLPSSTSCISAASCNGEKRRMEKESFSSFTCWRNGPIDPVGSSFVVRGVVHHGFKIIAQFLFGA